MNVVCTYHKDCIDGTAAAAVLLRAYPDAHFFPLPHENHVCEMKEFLSHVDKDTVVYTVDCGIGAREALEKGARVVTIDHHVGAKELWESLEREYPQRYTFVFDNDRSGATGTWAYIFPREPVPHTLELVQDADLWQWRYGDETKDVNNYLFMAQNDPHTMLTYLQENIHTLRLHGAVLSRYADTIIQKLVQIAPLTLVIGKYTVPGYNISEYDSACGNILSEHMQCAVVLYTIRGESVKFSIRSKEGQVPSALAIAKYCGGGGHLCAAGATIALDEFITFVQEGRKRP